MQDQKYLAIYARETCGSVDDLQQQCRTVLQVIPPELRELPIKVFSDVGSGLTGFEPRAGRKVRPGLQALVNDIRRGKVASVHVESEDRLSRSVLVAFDFLQICSQRGVVVYVGGRSVPGYNQEARLAHQIARNIADWQTGQLRIQQAEGRRHNRRE